MRDLRSRGYYCVRSAGSHSAVDIVAVKGDICLFVQAKVSGRVPADEWNALINLCASPHLLPIVASKKNGKIAYMLLTDEIVDGRRRWEPFDPGEDEMHSGDEEGARDD